MTSTELSSIRLENTAGISFPGRMIHLASLANVVGIVIFYVYYRFMNPDPGVSQFWKSSREANLLFFLLAALPFVVIGIITGNKNRWIRKIISREREHWSSEDKAQLLSYLFQQPRLYFIFSFLAWVFEGVLWGLIAHVWEGTPYGGEFLTTFAGTVVSGAVTALIAFIVADKISRQEVVKLFPQLESLHLPVKMSLKSMGLVMLCVVGVMPVIMVTYLSYIHAENAVLANDISLLSNMRDTHLLILGLSVFLTAMAMGWITRSISQPLVQLADLVKKVSSGDFSSNMPVVTDDEIGYVSSGLNRMIRELSALYQSLERKVRERTEELNEALRDVEMSNQKILDSIRYSKRIQHSLLPDPDTIRRSLPESFFLWQPRDMVGGDFYYAESFGDGLVIAVIDCTGHGIPGALMTMVAASALRRIVVDEACRNPSQILQRLNTSIKQLLHQDREAALSDDGLDASICLVDRKKRQLVFAGARQSLMVVRDGRVDIVRGDRHSIGYKKSRLDFQFSNQVIETDAAATFYIYTDGIVDQLGGPRRYPFGNRRLGELLLKIDPLPMAAKGEAILKAFREYCGMNEIQDDFTIAGFRV